MPVLIPLKNLFLKTSYFLHRITFLFDEFSRSRDVLFGNNKNMLSYNRSILENCSAAAVSGWALFPIPNFPIKYHNPIHSYQTKTVLKVEVSSVLSGSWRYASELLFSLTRKWWIFMKKRRACGGEIVIYFFNCFCQPQFWTCFTLV